MENHLCGLGHRNKKDARNEFPNVSVMASLVCQHGCIWNELKPEQQLCMPVRDHFLN